MTFPSQLSEILRRDVVALRLTASTAVEGIRELHRDLAASDAVTNAEEFFAVLDRRQRLGATCLDHTIATPHARTTAVSRLVFAVGRSDQRIFFDPEHPTKRLIFVIGVPTSAVFDFLHWIAQLTRLMRRSGVKRDLLATPSAEGLTLILAQGLNRLVP